MPRKRIASQCLRNIKSTRKLKPSLDFWKFLSANKTLQNPYKICPMKIDIIKSVVFYEGSSCVLGSHLSSLSGTQNPPPLHLWFSRERKAAPRYRRLLSTLSKHADPSLFTIDTAISKRQEFYSFHFKNFGNTKLFLFTDLFFLFHY